MRIVSYNILDGGEGRADPLAEILLAQNADIIALVEADNVDVLERIAARLNMDYIRGEGTSGHSVALLTRWRIVHSINHAAIRPSPPCLLETLIRQPDGPEWTIGVAHFSPRAFESNEQQREKELAHLLDIFRPHRQVNRPHILAGDFNANSPIQRIDPDRCKPTTRQAWQENGGLIPRRVIQTILDTGYVDTLQAAHGEPAATMYSFTTQFPGQRLDYIFTFALDARRITAAWIEEDRLAKYASDHFPIGAELGVESES